MPRQGKSEEAVMAGDGGRVPDVSEQRADVERMDDPHRAKWFEFCRSLTPEQTDVLREGLERRARRAFQSGRESATVRPDPASVLAALLAESPEATVAAIEALLTRKSGATLWVKKCPVDWCGVRWIEGEHCPRGHKDKPIVEQFFSASLLSKAPKENGDA